LQLWRWFFSTYGTEESPYTVETKIGTTRYIITADHNIIKAVLATQFADFGKGEAFHRSWSDFLGDSIFTTDGPAWHDSRQLIRPLFVKQRIGDLEIFERYAQKLMGLIYKQGQTTDLGQLFYRFTLDVATDFLFGESVSSLEKPQTEFATAISEVQRVQAKLARSGYDKSNKNSDRKTICWRFISRRPLFQIIPRGGFHRGLKTINSLIQPYVDRTLRLSPSELEEYSNTSSKDYTFLHALARSTGSPKKVRDELISLLFAGRDTTAATLSWLFYEIAARPEIVRRLRTEILSTTGADKLPTPDDLKQMKYLQQVVNETLRLYPALPFNVRFALRDTTVPSSSSSGTTQPLSVRAGDAIVYSTLVMQRRADIYPPESPSCPPPESFAPERWEHWTPKPWTYIPFNGGPRICVGQRFALTEIYFTVVRILQKFDRMERVEEGEQFLKAEVVGSPGRGVQVRFHEVE
jgi:cytochrome P450